MKRLLFALGMILVLGGAQESVPASGPTLDQIVDRANHQNPYYSAIGVKALKARGVGGIGALERFVARRSLYALAPLVVEWLGEVDDDRARTILRGVLALADFPWRPQAARALARSPRKGEIELFLGLAAHGLAAVREPALQALGVLGARDFASKPLALGTLGGALRDASYEPRLAAAEALIALDDDRALPALVDALSVERRFFDLDFGVLARRRAWAALQPIVGDACGYDPARGRAGNAAAIAAVREKLGSRLPPGAESLKAADDVDDALIGIEVRSCRTGDQWIRLLANGDLVLGHYDLERRRLDDARRREILRLVAAAQRGDPTKPRLDAGAYFGRPGCDFEKWYLPVDASLVRVSVGWEGRPEQLEELMRALADAVDATFGPDAGQEYRDRVAPFAKPDAGED